MCSHLFKAVVESQKALGIPLLVQAQVVKNVVLSTSIVFILKSLDFCYLFTNQQPEDKYFLVGNPRNSNKWWNLCDQCF